MALVWPLGQVLDGCGVSMPDTAANRARWPYAGGQKRGCGFPTAQMVGLFCLATGRLLRFAIDAWKAHEIPRARQARRLEGHQMTWAKPQRPETWSKSLWQELPTELAMRIVRFRVTVPGFRTEEVVLVTTLLDPKAYPDEALVALYRRHWSVELFFRDIKTTLGLDVLRSQSPELVEKEVWLQAIAYNLVRALMLEAA